MPENHEKCIMHMKRLLCMPRPDAVGSKATLSHTHNCPLAARKFFKIKFNDFELKKCPKIMEST